jgi:hemerythrin
VGIRWSESLAIGIEEIDTQHRELVQRFAGLLAACEEGRGREELKALLGFLDRYVQQHFSDEEALQQRCGYPFYQEHRSQHQAFIARISSLQQQIDGGGIELSHIVEINHLLYAWLVNHIFGADRDLGLFLEKRGRDAVTGG